MNLKNGKILVTEISFLSHLTWYQYLYPFTGARHCSLLNTIKCLSTELSVFDCFAVIVKVSPLCINYVLFFGITHCIEYTEPLSQ